MLPTAFTYERVDFDARRMANALDEEIKTLWTALRVEQRVGPQLRNPIARDIAEAHERNLKVRLYTLFQIRRAALGRPYD